MSIESVVQTISSSVILIIDRVIFQRKPEESQGAGFRDPGEEYCRHTRASVAGAEEARGTPSKMS